MITFRETSIINLFSYGIRWNVIGRIVRYRRINGSTVASCWFIWPQLNRFPALGNGIVGVEFPQLRPPRHLLVETTANWSGWNVTLDGSRGRQLPFSPFLHFLLPVKSKKKKGKRKKPNGNFKMENKRDRDRDREKEMEEKKKKISTFGIRRWSMVSRRISDVACVNRVTLTAVVAWWMSWLSFGHWNRPGKSNQIINLNQLPFPLDSPFHSY